MIYWFASTFIFGAPLIAYGLYPIMQWVDGNRVEWQRLIGGLLMLTAGMMIAINLAEKTVQVAKREAIERAAGI